MAADDFRDDHRVRRGLHGDRVVMKFITTKSFMPFVIYRVLLGIALFVLVGTGVLSPHADESGG
jgi:hypothetical protein